LQKQLDEWHSKHSFELASYKKFLEEIGYLVPAGPDFAVSTANVDAEIATICGPQLVVPIDNARYALNAANARWGSLFDALYGTDAISSEPKTATYSETRGALVYQRADALLDLAVPLVVPHKHADVAKYAVDADGHLTASLKSGQSVALSSPEKFVGFTGEKDAPTSVLFASRTSCSSRPSAPSRTARTRSPPSTPTTRPRSTRNWNGLMRGLLTADL
jgi:malate synthase